VAAAANEKPVQNFADLQQYVWERLPARKHALGREVVFDCVAVAVQEWPGGILENTKSGDTGEVIATRELARSVRRHLVLTYGENRFGSLWFLALQVLLPVLIDVMLRWWRSRKENRARLRYWQADWVQE
jgi:hypothetical protein